MEPGRRLNNLLAALAGVALLVVFAPPKVTDERSASPDASRSGGLAASAPRAESILGIRRETFSAQGLADLFSSTAWLPPPPVVATARPVAPAFPFHYVGRLVDGAGQMQIYLAQQGSGVIVTPKAGDVLASGFQVDAVSPNQIAVTYLPLKEKLTISYASLGSEPGVRQAGTNPVDTGVPIAAAADVVRVAGATAISGVSAGALPPIAGLAPIAAVAPAVASTNTGSVIGSSIAASPSTGSGGTSPAAPGAAPTGAVLGSAPVASGPIGFAPTASGMIGTPPTNTDASALNGPRPTSGGPAVK